MIFLSCVALHYVFKTICNECTQAIHTGYISPFPDIRQPQEIIRRYPENSAKRISMPLLIVFYFIVLNAPEGVISLLIFLLIYGIFFSNQDYSNHDLKGWQLHVYWTE